ncbi:MAG: A/G-specific adenine glycosylase [Verrucomicrobia bacterium]|nr:A/G-specific adenine glycosylase [Verrucomicrobiota bacterium]MBI3869743.1 A/G-specific adenine glycosylase [Verrucomicrobiota bacterium]
MKAARALLPWFRDVARDLPWRRTLDPYAIWVSEIMLQQTQVKTVIPYYERWMSRFPTAATLAGAHVDEVLKCWEGLGYYSRARNLLAAAQEITARHGGLFPRDMDQILDLPGIGRYTAGAISSIGFNEPRPILDGNVARVLARVHAIGADLKSREAQALLWREAQKWVSAASALPPQHSRELSGNCSALNQAIMELGATLCGPKDPQCAECPLTTLCRARQLDAQLQYPRPPKRVSAIHRSVYAFVVESGARVWIGQRQGGGANAGLWELPTVEVAPGSRPSAEEVFRQWSRVENARVRPLTRVKHSITRHRFETSAFHVRLSPNARRRIESRSPGLGWEKALWTDREQRAGRPFSAAHARIIAFWEAPAGA